MPWNPRRGTAIARHATVQKWLFFAVKSDHGTFFAVKSRVCKYRMYLHFSIHFMKGLVVKAWPITKKGCPGGQNVNFFTPTDLLGNQTFSWYKNHRNQERSSKCTKWRNSVLCCKGEKKSKSISNLNKHEIGHKVEETFATARSCRTIKMHKGEKYFCFVL